MIREQEQSGSRSFSIGKGNRRTSHGWFLIADVSFQGPAIVRDCECKKVERITNAVEAAVGLLFVEGVSETERMILGKGERFRYRERRM